MAEYATAQQLSSRYVLASPRGYRAVFNDSNDIDFVGYIKEITGLDSPEVRAELYDLVEKDGALAPYFYHGFRPITLTLEVFAATVAERNAREEKIRKVLNDCMRSEGTLTWTPEGGISQYVNVRKYQPFRASGGFKKDYFVSLVAPDPYIYSTDLRTAGPNAMTTPLTMEHQGNAMMLPINATFTGPANGVYVQNVTASTVSLRLVGYSLPSGQSVRFDFRNRTIVNLTTGANLYQYLDFPNNANWSPMYPGFNYYQGNADSGATGATTLTMTWRDGWL